MFSFDSIRFVKSLAQKVVVVGTKIAIFPKMQIIFHQISIKYSFLDGT